MSNLLLFLLMQYVVSVKAGLVNHAQGATNVAEQAMIRRGSPIQTGTNGYAEILLTPGAFLRLGEDAEAVLEAVELDDVRVRIVKGAAIIEAVQIKKFPIHVTTEKLSVDIVKAGIYRFENGTVTVLDGKVQVGPNITYSKGWQVFFEETYSAKRVVKATQNSLDVYSQVRSAEVARANLNMASLLKPSYREFDSWLFNPYFGMYTYLPHGNFRSPYGNVYYAAGYTNRSFTTNTQPNGNPAASNGTPNGNTNTPTNTGGGAAAGGATAERTVATPNGAQMTPAAYIQSKDPPAAVQE